MLISLLGSGNEQVARQTGVAYAWNTAGAIAGSLAGGFGLLPLLTAPGTWKLVVIVLALLSAVAAALSLLHSARLAAADASTRHRLRRQWSSDGDRVLPPRGVIPGSEPGARRSTRSRIATISTSG